MKIMIYVTKYYETKYLLQTSGQTVTPLIYGCNSYQLY